MVDLYQSAFDALLGCRPVQMGLVKRPKQTHTPPPAWSISINHQMRFTTQAAATTGKETQNADHKSFGRPSPPPPPNWTAGDGTGGKRKRAVNTRTSVSMTACGTFKDNPMRLHCQGLVHPIGTVGRWCACSHLSFREERE